MQHKRKILLVLSIIVVLLLYQGTRPPAADAQARWIQMPFFGAVKQERVEIALRPHEEPEYALAYPAHWRTWEPMEEFYRMLVPQLRNITVFGTTTARHTVFVSEATLSQVENAVEAAERTEARLLNDERDTAHKAGTARKLSFGTTREGNAVTYYLFDGAEVVGLRIQGPGNLELDEAARVMLNSFSIK